LTNSVRAALADAHVDAGESAPAIDPGGEVDWSSVFAGTPRSGQDRQSRPAGQRHPLAIAC
jgi:hypothetical protein